MEKKEGGFGKSQKVRKKTPTREKSAQGKNKKQEGRAGKSKATWKHQTNNKLDEQPRRQACFDINCTAGMLIQATFRYSCPPEPPLLTGLKKADTAARRTNNTLHSQKANTKKKQRGKQREHSKAGRTLQIILLRTSPPSLGRDTLGLGTPLQGDSGAGHSGVGFQGDSGVGTPRTL